MDSQVPKEGFEDPFGYAFSTERLKGIADAHASRFSAASPFRHCVIDDFVDVAGVQAALPTPPGPWRGKDYDEQSVRFGGLQRRGFRDVEPIARALTRHLIEAPFLTMLERVTGHEGMIADPYFRAAGFHWTGAGGHLGLHTDFARDRHRDLERALTALLFVHPEWDPIWGGALELWDQEACRTAYLPLPGRLILLDHGSENFHGQPRALRCPEGHGRVVLSSIYYQVKRPRPDCPRGATWHPLAGGRLETELTIEPT